MSKTIAINDLKTNLFVRRELNQDRVQFFTELLEGGVKLSPILITPNNEVIDGRHRIEAHELNDLNEIRCEVVGVRDEVDLISQAYKANCGESLPPSTQDTEHTVVLLLDRGVAQKRIATTLGLPPSMARKYINQIKSKMNRAKLMQAADSVKDDGMTVPKAAEKHGVDPDKLREVLSARQNRHKPGIAEVQRTLTRRYKSISLSNASLLKRLLEKIEDGDVTEKQVRSIFDHLEDLQRKSARAVTDWKKRFETMVGGNAAPKTTVAAKLPTRGRAKGDTTSALRKMGLA